MKTTIKFFIATLILVSITACTNPYSCSNQFSEAYIRGLDNHDPSVCKNYDGPFNVHKDTKSGSLDCSIREEDHPELAKYTRSVRIEAGRYDTIDYESSCLQTMAVILEDPDICMLIDKPRTFEDPLTCLDLIASKTGNQTMCVELESEIPNWPDCLRHIAHQTLNTSFCLMFEEEPKRSVCLITIAEDLNDSTACSLITNLSRKEQCMLGVAVNSNTLSICDNTGMNVLTYRECIREMAIKLNDPEKCVSDNETTKDNCLRETATYKKDVSICDGINDAYVWSYCIMEYARINKDPLVCRIIYDELKKRSATVHPNDTLSDDQKAMEAGQWDFIQRYPGINISLEEHLDLMNLYNNYASCSENAHQNR